MFIASLGWDHAGWSGPFYPDDLPPEWRLAFYANEFRAVVVPAALWRKADATTVGQWVADTGEGFRFFFEPDVGGAVPSRAVLAVLGERCGGVLGSGGVAAAHWAGGAEARALRDVLEGMPADGVLLVAGEPPSLAALRMAQTLVQLLGRDG